MVSGGDGVIKQMNMIVSGEPDLSNQRFEKCRVDGTLPQEWCDLICDWGPISSDLNIYFNSYYT